MIDIDQYLNESLHYPQGPREKKSIIRAIREDLFAGRRYHEKTNSLMNQLSEITNKINSGVPVQHITGTSYFFDVMFQVSKEVLIPRPETEELVDWILMDHGQNQALKILDIGTGSGCIAIILALKRMQWTVTGIDNSKQAIDIANRNANRLGAIVNFKIYDFLLDEVSLNDFHIIVSNPPYIGRNEIKYMDSSVLQYEPEAALFPIGDDPLIFYKRIADLIGEQKFNGFIYLELNEYLFKEIAALFIDFEIEIREDLQGKKRMLRINIGI